MSATEGVLSEKVVPPPPLRGERPSALLYADKPAVVATDAIIPRRPPNLGGEFKVLDNRYIITKRNANVTRARYGERWYVSVSLFIVHEQRLLLHPIGSLLLDEESYNAEDDKGSDHSRIRLSSKKVYFLLRSYTTFITASPMALASSGEPASE